MTTLLLLDYANLLDALTRISDNTTTARIYQPPSNPGNSYTNTYKLPNTATAQDLANKLTALAVDLDNDILYGASASSPLTIDTGAGGVSITGNVLTVKFTSGDPSTYLTSGSFIKFSGFKSNGSAQDLAGIHTVATVSSTQFTVNLTGTFAAVS